MPRMLQISAEELDQIMTEMRRDVCRIVVGIKCDDDDTVTLERLARVLDHIEGLQSRAEYAGNEQSEGKAVVQ
jgi:hypothetical protein